jgi:hypothetical protein
MWGASALCPCILGGGGLVCVGKVQDDFYELMGDNTTEGNETGGVRCQRCCRLPHCDRE